MNIIDRLSHAYNAFKNPTSAKSSYDLGISYGNRPDRLRLHLGNERSIVASVYNRIAIDVASVDVRHVKIDDNERFLEEIDSGLNYCLSEEANIDQTGRQLIMDIVMSLFDEGCVAVVPTAGEMNLDTSTYFRIDGLRVAKIIE